MSADGTGKRVFRSILLGLLAAGVLIYATVQIRSYFSSKVEIARLREYSIEDKTEGRALFFRDEQLVLSGAGGCDYSVESGQKVAVGDRLAVLYYASGSEEKIAQINALQLQIDSLTEIYEQGTDFDFDVTRLDTQINETIGELLAFADAGEIADSSQDIKQLSQLMNKHAILSGADAVTAEQIAVLQARLDELTTGAEYQIESINSSVSGFFVYEYDGAEGRFPLDMADRITVDKLDEYLAFDFAERVPEGYVGSVIDGFEWLCAFSVPEDVEYSVGDSVRLRFPDTSEDTVTAQVRSISASKDGRRVMTVGSIKNLSLLTGARVQTVQLISRRYTGLWVSRDAVCMQNDVVGVYVLKGQIIDFTPIEIVYSGDENVLIQAAEGASLAKNDDVVISGRDLYDGKVVQYS